MPVAIVVFIVILVGIKMRTMPKPLAIGSDWVEPFEMPTTTMRKKMQRMFLLLAGLPLIPLPLTSLAASPTVATPALAASLLSEPMPLSGASNNPVLISQYYPDGPRDSERAEYWRRVREHRDRCENFREYLLC